jgi:2-hydroxychromene-2-carboxylate isomerase
MRSPSIEFWFGYGSTYTYLSALRIEPLLRGANINLVWRPFNLTTLMRDKGFPRGPFAERPDKLAYMWRDMERRAERFNLPYRRPSVYPVDSQRTVRVGILASHEGWCADFTRKVLTMNFAEGRPIGSPGQLEKALSELGRDPEATIRQAHSEDIERALASQTTLASELGVFGSPTFIVDGEVFWGDDRLEDAIAWATQTP